MSNERSPRASCWITIGMRGMGFSWGALCNLSVAHASLSATRELQEAPLPAVTREIVLPVERERAWELLTEPAELEEWLADEVELEPEEGEEHRLLRFRWDDDATGIPSRVEWTLHDAPGGTRVRVVEVPLVPIEV